MNIKELKEAIKDLPDNMPVKLLDYHDDDSDTNAYSIGENAFGVETFVKFESEETLEVFTLQFGNHHLDEL